jgi:putative molybdopterin biosynthesis protein
MPDHADEFLTTKQLAAMLHVKERKIYDLAAADEIPCTRATGKLLFRRAAIEAWLAGRDGRKLRQRVEPPNVVVGSHDPLLEWSLRESSSQLAMLFDGGLDGLERLQRREGIATGLHVFDPATSEWNTPLVRQRFGAEPVVLIEWAWRERGLIVAPGNPRGVRAIEDLAGLRVVPRQETAASQILLRHYLERHLPAPGAVEFSRTARTEVDAVLAVVEGEADAAFGLHAYARQYRLDFVPLLRERFDLLIWRRECFEQPLQRLLGLVASANFKAKAAALAGYDASGLGRVHFNGP